MALKDLVVSQQKLSEKLLERILRGKIELIQDKRKVLLTKECMSLTKKNRVLFLLAGGEAWKLIDKKSWDITPDKMGAILAIPGSTLRSILKRLRDNFLVTSKKGKYSILPKGLIELENYLKSEDINTYHSAKTPASQRQKKTATRKKSSGIKELIKDGFFSTSRHGLKEIHKELTRKGVMIKYTSLPSYLLPLLRKKVLTRHEEVRGKRKTWVYSAPKETL